MKESATTSDGLESNNQTKVAFILRVLLANAMALPSRMCPDAHSVFSWTTDLAFVCAVRI
jgi:hypothetical protein